MTSSVVRSSLPAIAYSDEMKREHPSIFAYGIAGTGKTHALRTLAPLHPLVLATEIGNTKGMSTLADMHIACVCINTLEELLAVISDLQAKATSDGLMYDGRGPFGVLAVDSFTGVGSFLETAVRKLKGWKMIWDNAKGDGKDPRNAYPYIAERGRQVFASLMSLPVPLVVTCREQTVTVGEGKNTVSYPAPELPGQKLPKELPGWPEASIRLRKINQQRVFVTTTEGDAIARIRTAPTIACPTYIKPDFHALIRLLQEDATALDDLRLS
jgi:hypothetical protein